VVEASTGRGALEQVRTLRPDLVLVDARLPDISGDEVCRRLKRDPDTASVPVLQTFSPAGRDGVRGLDGYADGYLALPAEPLALAAQVRSLLRLRAAQRALQEREASFRERRREFLATLAHELRNPLVPLRTAIDLMAAAGDGEAFDAEQHNVRAIVARQIDHLVRLLDDLLDVARVEHDWLALRRARVELHSVVDSACEAITPLLRAGGHQLRVTLPQGPVWLDGDGVRLAQALGNLLRNAIEYTPAGGQVALTARDAGPCLEIEVTDDGIGIAADQLDAIFEPFTHARRVDGQMPEGLGVGLALARRLVELHGGVVTARSAGPGAGSTFRIELPLPDGDNGCAPPPVRREAALAPGALRILLVDDSRDAVDLLGRLLGRLGHEVEVAYDGSEALAVAERFAPHLALLDIGLPGMDGYALARALRGMPTLRHTQVVALTGYGQQEDRERALASGFDRHLVKPLDLERLRALLDELRPVASGNAFC
jgi:signal transduction histidine kinase